MDLKVQTARIDFCYQLQVRGESFTLSNPLIKVLKLWRLES